MFTKNGCYAVCNGVKTRVKKMFAGLMVLACVVGLVGGCQSVEQQAPLTRLSTSAIEQQMAPAPTFDNNPQLDMILTNARPVLSIKNPVGMTNAYTITYEISPDPHFLPHKTIIYEGIPQQNRHISEKQVEPRHQLNDGVYYWRAKTVDHQGRSSNWVGTRFYVDVQNSRTFSGYLRAPVQQVSVSTGEDPENIIDWSDQGQITYWNNSPRAADEPFSWVVLDMGRKRPITRLWMLSTRQTTQAPGWLTHFVWQGSHDGRTWADIEGTEIKNMENFNEKIAVLMISERCNIWQLFIKGDHDGGATLFQYGRAGQL